MRVTNSMLLSQAMLDLDGLREKYAKAQAAVTGNVLERPSDDPQRVVEAMDLSGTKLRLERAQQSGQDAQDWLSMSENGLSSMIESLQSAREIAVQSGGPAAMGTDASEALARDVLSIRDAVMREMNGKYREQYLFAGWNSNTQPFVDATTGGVTYAAANNGQIVRDVAPGLSIGINVTGNQLLANGDFMKTLTDMAADLRAGRSDTVTTTRLHELDQGLSNLIIMRSDLGTRQSQVAQYETYSQDALVQIEDRLGKLTGANLETAVLNMTQAQASYQAALASFSKALPTSLLDYMLR